MQKEPEQQPVIIFQSIPWIIKVSNNGIYNTNA